METLPLAKEQDRFSGGKLSTDMAYFVKQIIKNNNDAWQ